MTTPIGKYRLIKLIASGGMAEVYLAKQAGAAGFEKLVCLKRILPHLARDKQFVDMFLNEARLAAQLDHPNIVQIFDLGESNGNYFIAMEFIDGPNLRSVARRASELGELLPIPEVVRIIAAAAGGLHYAHELADAQTGEPLGLVHRDISPDNVLVHKNGSVKVVDFGIAKAANSAGQTRTGTLKGKVAYMPPEQLRGEALDRRVDVFALGVVLYELLAGKRPWEGTSEVALIGKIMSEEPQPLAELRPDAPPEILDIIHRALSKDRDARYQACSELQAELEQALVHMGQSVPASRVSDFVRAYSPQEAGAATTGVENAELSELQESAFGGSTGAAPALVGERAAFAHQRDSAGQDEADGGNGTVLMDEGPPPAQRKSGLVYGVGAFLAIAIVGGGAAFYLTGHAPDDDRAVPVERTTVALQQPQPPAEAKKEEPKAEPKAAEAKPPEPKPEEKKDDHRRHEHRVASVTQKPAEPAKAPEPVKVAVQEPPKPAPPVVIIKQPEPQQAPPPVAAPPPIVTAKGQLIVLARPWANVTVDAQELGITPLREPITLTAGEHKVRLRNPELGKDVIRTVMITPNGKETIREIFEE